jgi:FemAB-related protein (PEP-CTERM system-associated)
MRVRELCREESGQEWKRWDAYVRQAAQGLPQHLAGWQTVLHNAYGYETRYLLAERDQGAIAGVLPLFVLRSPLLGSTLTTLPGGMCADDEEAAAALLDEAQKLTRSLRAKRLVLHDSRQAHNSGNGPAGLHTTCDHEDWVLELHDGEEAVLAGLDRNIRRQIRIAQRNELTAVIDRTGATLDDFYTVMSRFTHQAGTPIFARKFLAEVIAAFPNGFNIVMVYQNNQPVGGYFQLELGKGSYGTWGATLHEFLELRPVYLAYWTIIADSIAQGFETLDMGRSPAGSNASKYKSQWATRSQPVYQQTWTPGAQPATSVATQAQSDQRFQTFRRIWPRLPLSVAQWVGPLIRRQIPFG